LARSAPSLPTPVAKLATAPDLGSGVHSRLAGSSPAGGTHLSVTTPLGESRILGIPGFSGSTGAGARPPPFVSGPPRPAKPEGDEEGCGPVEGQPGKQPERGPACGDEGHDHEGKGDERVSFPPRLGLVHVNAPRGLLRGTAAAGSATPRPPPAAIRPSNCWGLLVAARLPRRALPASFVCPPFLSLPPP
jgi:hypothetical protein